MGHIQCACFVYFCHLKKKLKKNNFKLHWVWLTLFHLHGLPIPYSLTQLNFTCLVPEGIWSWEPGGMTSLDSISQGMRGDRDEAGLRIGGARCPHSSPLIASSVAIPNLQPSLSPQAPVSWLSITGFSAGKRGKEEGSGLFLSYVPQKASVIMHILNVMSDF